MDAHDEDPGAGPTRTGASGPPANADATGPSSAALAPTPASPGGAGAALECGEGDVFGGRYRLDSKLGAGGMGVVWKAWDGELRRWVALKQIRADQAGGPTALARFVREARLAARLRHPGIVPVHDVGVADGVHFLTMDWVQGTTLAAVLAERRADKQAGARRGLEALRHELGLFAEVAEAVGHAHAEGVIHRDLKPANVMVDPAGKALVMDFGIAKEVRAAVEGELSALTQSGQCLGTPRYMSPEQAQGDTATIGPRADVWSLGIVLYEILAGRTPFEDAGSPVAVLTAVLLREPVRPRARHPHVPPELEAVCLKALEKDPARRYPTGRELAEEVRRWLRGEPVEARAPGRVERAVRWMSRHRAAVAAVGAILLAAAVAGGSALWVTGVRGRLLTHLREAARTAVDGALAVRRKGMPGAMASHRPALERACRDAVEALGATTPEPPYCLGRFARAEMKMEEALARQLEALAIDPTYAPALYEAIVLEARAWSRRSEVARAALLERAGVARREPDGAPAATPPPEPALAELEGFDPELPALRRRLQARLDALRAAAAPGALAPPERACAEGILAAYLDPVDAPWDAARARLEEALRADPGKEEAYEALHAGAVRRDRLPEALEACTRGIAADPGYVPFRLSQAALLARLGEGEGDLAAREAKLREAVAGLEEALRLAPELDVDRLDLGHYRSLLAKCRAEAGDAGEAAAGFGEALAGVDEVLARQPASVPALLRRASIHEARGWTARDQPAEFAADLEAAITDLDRAIEAEPREVELRFRRGGMRTNRALLAAGRGEDAEAGFAAAVADFTEAIARDPRHQGAWEGRGYARKEWASIRRQRGGDPAELTDGALADFDAALALRPDDPRTLAWRGAVRLVVAVGRDAQRQDAAEALAGATADFDRALELDPRIGAAWAGRAKCRVIAAQAQLRQGIDSSELLVGALADYDQAVSLRPADPYLRYDRGQAGLSWGLWLLSRAADPAPRFAPAAADLERAAQALPQNAMIRRDLAVLHHRWGQGKLRAGGSPAEDFAAAVAHGRAAYGLVPGLPGLRSELAGMLLDATVPLLAREDGSGEAGLREAIALLDEAAAAGTGDAAFHFQRGRARLWLGQVVHPKGEDPLPSYRGAEEDLTRALEMGAQDLSVRIYRARTATQCGVVAEQRGEDPRPHWERAERDYAEVAARAPKYEGIRAERERLRESLRRLGGK